MKDATGKDLRLGQRVAIPCNSRFKIGILYNYRPNRTRWYLEAVRYRDNADVGIYPEDHRDYYDRYWTREYVNTHANNYYVEFPDGKKRTISDINSILGIDDEGKITL
jgi:hypothetical protein